MDKVIRVFDDWERQENQARILRHYGIEPIKEQENYAYCPLPLTGAPQELKPELTRRQEILKEILQEAGIESYDPNTAPLSPEKNLTGTPEEVYNTDAKKVALGRMLVGNLMIPSTGTGVEWELASEMGKLPIMLVDRKVRISRMQGPRTITLAYDDLEEQKEEFIEVFKLIRQCPHRIGLDGNKPCFFYEDEKGNYLRLDYLIFSRFPHLKYQFDGTVPIIKTMVLDPEQNGLESLYSQLPDEELDRLIRDTNYHLEFLKAEERRRRR